MKKKSLFYNSIFNCIKTLSNVAFPVITFTYSAHILGVDGVGQVSFAKSISTYYTMIALLGMNHYGTREVAKLRYDKNRLSKYVHEMLIINLFATIVAYGLLFLSLLFIPKLSGYKTLLLINSLAIVLQGLGMEWLYQGMEDYQYIAVRSILFQIGALAALPCFVRNTTDVNAYAAILLIASSGSYTLNFINARKYVHLHRYEHYEFRKHIKPLLWLFAMVVSIELYTVLDSTMLGFLQGDTAVGKYTAAVKVNKMTNSLITAAGVVLIPRLSFYISRKEKEKVQELVKKAYNYTFMLSVPAMIGLFMLSDEIIFLFSGMEFASAGFTMRLLTPIVLVIPFSVVTNNQVLIPMGKERLILFSTVLGAVTNFMFNLLLIPYFAENGAAIATVLAETAVAFICYINISRYFDMRKVFQEYYHYCIAALPIIPIALIARGLAFGVIMRMLLIIMLSISSYFLILCLLGNRYCLEVIHILCKRINRF